jgi:hypothetical protein
MSHATDALSSESTQRAWMAAESEVIQLKAEGARLRAALGGIAASATHCTGCQSLANVARLALDWGAR